MKVAERGSAKGSRSFSEYKTHESAFTTRSIANKTHSRNQSHSSNTCTNCPSQPSGDISAILENPARCAPEEERAARDWLASLGLTVAADKEFSTLLANPYRNGTLLCTLFEVLEGKKVEQKVGPNSVMQAQENIRQALSAFQRFGKLPRSGAEAVRGILRGDKNAIWGLLSKIREHYDLHISAIGMDEYKSIETSLISWLKSLGVICHSESRPIAEIEKLRNGTALCKLAEILLKKPHKLLNNPKSEANRLANIRVALNSFKQLPRLDTKQLCSEREILQGNRNAILLMLEELRKYHDTNHIRKNSFNSTMKCKSSCNEQLPWKGSKTLSEAQGGKGTCVLESNSLSCVKPGRANTYFTPSREQDISPEPIYDSKGFRSEYGLTQRSLRAKDENCQYTSRHDSLLNWLAKLKVDLPKGFSLDRTPLPEFADGILLCRIAEALERRPVEGIIKGPGTSASSAHNIRKVLELLYKRKVIPLECLRMVDKVHKGQGDVVVDLLRRIREGYDRKSARKGLRTRKNPFGTISSIENNAEGSNNSLERKF